MRTLADSEANWWDKKPNGCMFYTEKQMTHRRVLSLFLDNVFEEEIKEMDTEKAFELTKAEALEGAWKWLYRWDKQKNSSSKNLKDGSDKVKKDQNLQFLIKKS